MKMALDNERRRLQAEVFDRNTSLGSYVTDGDHRVIIGSSKRADLVVQHASVSHIHAMLRLKDKEILLYDLGSEQGTFVGGQKIVERSLKPGEFFEIGGHRVKVNLIEEDAENGERALFWKSSAGNGAHLEILRTENSTVYEERTLARNAKVVVGRRRNEILLNGTAKGTCFLSRKDGGNAHTVDCLVPEGYTAEIYDANNELVRTVEQAGSRFTFNEREKARLVTADQRQEILVFWSAEGRRAARSMTDPDSHVMKRAMIVCSAIFAIVAGLQLLTPTKTEEIAEITTPKSSYFRLSMDSAPAPAAPAAQEESAASNQTQQAAPSKAASISSSLSKLLNKKSSLTADKIQQAISTNGTTTVRGTNLKNANIQSEQIAAGSVGGGSLNVNALSAGLGSGSGTKAGSLKGFANGTGTGIGGGSGFGGKGFDMSLGGDEAEAIGGLDKALIAAVVQSNLGQIKHCYEKQLIIDPNIFGKIVANWTINQDGLVSVTSVKSTTMKNKAVENCILAKIKNWNFPKPKGGGQVLVSYPFLFKSLN